MVSLVSLNFFWEGVFFVVLFFFNSSGTTRTKITVTLQKVSSKTLYHQQYYSEYNHYSKETPTHALKELSKNKVIYIGHFVYFDLWLNTSRVFTNGPGDRGSIPAQVIPKTQKNGTFCRLV